jgi:predicted heme/steroid binding protein/FKBP-type peptidyl-prolyl cis-trans isomerase 2
MRIHLHLTGANNQTPHEDKAQQPSLEAQRNRMAMRTVRGGDTIKVTVTGVAQGTSTDAGMFENDTTTFKVGPDTKGPLQPELSKAVLGTRVGEVKDFLIRPTNAAHPQPERDEKLVMTVPTGEATVHIGATVRLQHEGTFRLATIVDMDAQKKQATIDMNDPLAGKVLVYTVIIEEMDADVDLSVQLFPEPLGVPNKIFTLQELRKYNGQNSLPIYMGVNGYVYDMTSGSKFYGPGGTYGFMSGHDSTVALAKFSMNPGYLNQPWTLKEFSDNELNTLANYIRNFSQKYPIVGKIISESTI